MAVGAGGTILRSLDGKTWTKVRSGTFEYLNGIVWDGQRYIAVGNKGTVPKVSENRLSGSPFILHKMYNRSGNPCMIILLHVTFIPALLLHLLP